VAQSQREADELVGATRAEHDEIVAALMSLKSAVADMLRRGTRGSEAIRVVLDDEAEVKLTEPQRAVI